MKKRLFKKDFLKKNFLAAALALAFTYIGSFACTGYAVSDPSGTASASKAAEPSVTAQTAIVADANSGLIYYQKDMHKKMYPASITKIMTGLLAVEKGRGTDQITVTPEVQKGIFSGAQSIGLAVGERLTQEEALYTMFLRSANDSANALALHIGGTMQNFVGMMNARAKALGCTDTHFDNANGLPDKNNLTSAYDMALITQKAVHESLLMKYFGATAYSMPATNKRKATTYSTLHKMMRNTVYRYDGVVAGKTGWETMSGHTLVTVAKRDGRTLICVVMKSSSGYTVYKDTIALLDYSFALPQGDSLAAADPSGNYLNPPVKAAVAKPAKKPKATADKPKKQEETEQRVPGGSMAAPLVLLASSICIFAFLSTCRSVKQPRRRARRRTIN